MPPRATWCGVVLRRPIDRPSIVPPRGGTTPEMTRRSVVLPAPLGPRSVTASPAPTVIETSSRTDTDPYPARTPRTSSNGEVARSADRSSSCCTDTRLLRLLLSRQTRLLHGRVSFREADQVREPARREEDRHDDGGSEEDLRQFRVRRRVHRHERDEGCAEDRSDHRRRAADDHRRQ